MSAGKNPRVTFANDVKPACVSRTQMDFWDGMKHGCLMPKSTAKGMGTPGTAGVWLTHIWGFPWGGRGSAVVSGGSLFGAGDVMALFICHQNARLGVLGGWQPPDAERDLIFFAFQSDHLSGMQCLSTSRSTSCFTRWVGTHVALVPLLKSRKLTPKVPTKRPIGIAQARCCLW